MKVLFYDGYFIDIIDIDCRQYRYHIYIYGDFLKLGGGTPIAGWLIMKHPFKIYKKGGSH